MQIRAWALGCAAVAVAAWTVVGCGENYVPVGSQGGGAQGGAAGSGGLVGGGGQGGQGPSGYTIGGTVAGLSGGTLVIENSGGDELTVSVDGPFAFETPLEDGAGYEVTIAEQPAEPAQICTVSRGAGTVDGADVTDVVIACLGAVQPLYSTAGADWNDYVDNDGATRLGASDQSCPASGGGYGACIHGGELRVVEVPGKSACTDLSASDELGAFRWICSDEGGSARMVSTGLELEAGLSDLVDFAEGAWRENRVTVSEGSTLYAVSPWSVWWGNAVEVDDDGGELGDEGTVYLVTSSPSPQYEIAASKVALAVDPAIVLSWTAPGQGVVWAEDQKHLWFEGAIDAAGAWWGVGWQGVSFSVVRHAEISGADSGGVAVGLYLSGSSDNLIHGLVAANSGGPGVLLGSESDRNTVLRLAATNGGNAGVVVGESHNNVLANAMAAANSSGGIVVLGGGQGNAVLGASVANSSAVAVHVDAGGSRTTVAMTAAANNGGPGLRLTGTSSTLADIAVAMCVPGVQVEGGGNYFTGFVKLGNPLLDCQVDGSPVDPGMDGSCAPQGASDFTLRTQISLSSTFVAKVAVDDAENASDTDGAAELVDITDWTSFDNGFRGWGIDGGAFPSSDHHGPCAGLNVNCRIWDWSLAEADADGDPNGGGEGVPGPALLEVLELPTGDDTLVHIWAGSATSQAQCDALVLGSVYHQPDETCRTTHLRRAVEIVGDGVGNENLLCESAERCRFWPNIGAYPGHGALVSAGAFVDGAITGVTLLRHQTNGY